MSIDQSTSYLKCPRCGKHRLHPAPVMNALSRRDNQTYVCSPCGSHEALLDAARNMPELAVQMAEFMSEDLDHPFEILSEEEELDLWCYYEKK